MSEGLHTIVYFSHATRDYDDAALLDLLEIARHNNKRRDITGMLLYHEGSFIQALEGQSDNVQSLYSRISKDANHKGIIATRLLPIETRQFPDWSMGFIAFTSLPETARETVNDFLQTGPGRDDAVGTSLAWALLRSFRDSVVT